MSGVSLYDRVLGIATDERLRGWAIKAAIALLQVVACTLYRFSSLDVPEMNGFKFGRNLHAVFHHPYEVYELIRGNPSPSPLENNSK